MMKTQLLLIIGAVILLGVGSVQAIPLGYYITDLGNVNPYSINDHGQVVGSSNNHTVLWENGAVTDLGTLGGSSSYAYGINDAGQVVGKSLTGVSVYWHAFLWDSSNGMVDLGTLGGHSSGAYGINYAGQVVGESYISIESVHIHAFLWKSGNGMMDLGTLGGSYSQAYAINDAGQVVGLSQISTGYTHGFLWDGSNGMTDLGSASEVRAINNAGQVVGRSSICAFLWEDGTVIDLGPLDGESNAYSINNAGDVVGWADTVTSDEYAFLYSGGEMINLNDLLLSGYDWQLRVATGINNVGQIVGSGYIGGKWHGFVMTPIPEPSIIFLFGLGGLLLKSRITLNNQENNGIILSK